MPKLYKTILTTTFWAVTFLFWMLLHPEILGFQEQNQLFLFTWDYLGERLSLSGGLADWIGEFLVQFYAVKWLGAAILATILTILAVLVWKVANKLCEIDGYAHYPLAFIPSSLLLVSMGDIYVTMAWAVALVAALALAIPLIKSERLPALVCIIVTLAGYWLVGPAIWLTVIIMAPKKLPATGIACIISLAVAMAVAAFTLQRQYALVSNLFGINYNARPDTVPAMQLVTFASAVVLPFVLAVLREPRHNKAAVFVAETVVITAATISGIYFSYDKDSCRTLAFDQLIRQEKWEETISRAQKYQPQSDLCCVCVNLALYMSGRFDELDRFCQTGPQGLLMPRVRDCLSNVSTGEAFWRLGMVNSALRYAFDSQESIPNLRKSGRAMMRIAECQIVNGRYEVASKYLDILKHSLFYRKWAVEHELLLGDEDAINTHPVYGYIRQIRFDSDFLYYYPEMDKMLAILYKQNNNNLMAAYYSMAWSELSKTAAAK